MNRQQEKQASRDLDNLRLENGEISREELSKENNFFVALDLSSFKIVAIGNKPFKVSKEQTSTGVANLDDHRGNGEWER